jgi:hypothetical protein
MRKLLLFLSMFQVMLAFAQVGVHTDTPDNSSAMDIVASNRGLLIPRVTLTSSLSNPSPVSAPAVGLLVFNSGSNQPVGFYYWNGTTWTQIGTGGSGGGNDWTLTGNSGTTPGTNFLGTTDNKHFLVYTNNVERMRFESDGQIVIDSIAPRNATDLFTVIGNASQTTTVAAYPRGTGFYSKWGRYGLVALVDTAAGTYIGYGVYARNYDSKGYGISAIGSGVTTFPVITNHTTGLVAYGYDGLQAWGRRKGGYGIFAIGDSINAPYNLNNVAAGLSSLGKSGIIAKGAATKGRGLLAIDSLVVNPTTTTESEGASLNGFHGLYSRGLGYQTTPTVLAGVGVIGIGYGYSNYSTLTGGTSLGGTFSGDYGIYGKGLATAGVGVLGLGSSSSTYYTITNGSGGAFTGYHGILSVGNNATYGHGIVAAGNNGVYSIVPNGAGGAFTGTNVGAAGYSTSASGGIGVIGAGNGGGAIYPSSGAGGAFNGNTGVYTQSTSSSGTGIVSSGNNIASPQIYASGSGGSFTGTAAGLVGYGMTGASGVGVIGLGNGTTTAQLPGSSGCGGAFTGVTYGVYGFATTASSTRGGGYFACNPTSGGAYAYCGYRNGSTNYKTIGNGTNSTIVKNRQGDLITLYCPEAPEVVFQDYGIGQLTNGFAHISLDPDLSLNINVSDDHPMKVFVTLEGDCKGVYITNKSVTGFDVVELQGGNSNVQFSWQIVATRANEQTTLTDGSIEHTTYDMRFGPAPGPLEEIGQDGSEHQMKDLKIEQVQPIRSGEDSYHLTLDQEGKTLEVKEDSVINIQNDPNE